MVGALARGRPYAPLGGGARKSTIWCPGWRRPDVGSVLVMVLGGPVDFGSLLWILVLALVVAVGVATAFAGLIAYLIARQKIAFPIGMATFAVVGLLGLVVPGIETWIAALLGLLASVFAGVGLAAARPHPTIGSEHIDR